MTIKQKLELTWIGKDKTIKVEPRILVHDGTKDYGDKNTDNMLIYGDNLLALKALEQEYAGKVKCIYIDPPYNTGSAFEHYDDNLEHSTWLSLMKPRLEILRNLLADDGVIFVQIDANEMPYLKVLMDEIFKRCNFINIISCKAKIAGVSGSHLGKSLQDNVEYILCYSKEITQFNLYSIPQKTLELNKYIEDMESAGKSWKYTSVLQGLDQGTFLKSFLSGSGETISLYRHDNYQILSIQEVARLFCNHDIKKAYYKYIDSIFRTTNAQTSIRQKVIEEIQGIEGELFSIEYAPSKGKNAGKKIRSYYKGNNLIAWLKDVVKVKDNHIYKLDNMGNLWDDIQYNNLTKEGEVQFPNGKKPEMLLQRILEMATQPNDLVLDSFLGSGTTAAVAHKMGRKYIGIELGEHCHTHCIPRLQKVIDGTDQGGISKTVGWKGGGGFKYYYLAPSLLNKDKYGQYVISKEYNADMLAAAMAKHEGFLYAPDQDQFWKQGKSSENDYIYTTTNHVGADVLAAISGEMKDDESLLICCKSFDAGVANGYSNITVKKIPGAILGSCEFDKDNYNLNIINPPVIDEEE